MYSYFFIIHNNAWRDSYVHFLIQHYVPVLITIKTSLFSSSMETLTSKAFCEVSQSFAEVHNYSKSCSIYGSKKVPNYSPIGDGWINDFWRRPFHSRCGRIIFWQKCFMATVSGLTDELVLTIIVIVVVIGGAWCCCDLDRHSKNGRFFSLEDDIFEKGQWGWSLLTFQRTIDYALIGEHFF